MKRHRSAAMAVLAATTILASALGLAGPAAAAEDPCLMYDPVAGPWNGGGPIGELPGITNVPLKLQLILPIPLFDEPCTGMAASLQKTDGTQYAEVALPHAGTIHGPPGGTVFGYTSIPVANGVGDWAITKISHGASVRTVNVPFRIVRATTISLDQPATTAGSAKTTVTGSVRRYISTGALVANPGRAVTIRHASAGQVLGTAVTDSNGRYRVQIRFTRTTEMLAKVSPVGYYGSAVTSYTKTAHKLMQLATLSASPNATVGVYWKVSGSVFPGKIWTTLEYLDGSTWVNTQSFGYNAADGTFARYWKPTRAGIFQVRLTLSATGLDNTPLRKQMTITAR